MQFEIQVRTKSIERTYQKKIYRTIFYKNNIAIFYLYLAKYTYIHIKRSSNCFLLHLNPIFHFLKFGGADIADNDYLMCIYTLYRQILARLGETRTSPLHVGPSLHVVIYHLLRLRTHAMYVSCSVPTCSYRLLHP